MVIVAGTMRLLFLRRRYPQNNVRSCCFVYSCPLRNRLGVLTFGRAALSLSVRDTWHYAALARSSYREAIHLARPVQSWRARRDTRQAPHR